MRLAEGIDITDPGAQAALTEALTTYTIDGLHAAGSTLPVTTLRALLALDMELSAQGLAHWMRHP